MERLWGPLFKKLQKHLPCYVHGYTEIIVKLLLDVDSSIISKNAISLGIFFKVYPYIFEALLPFIDDERTSDVLREIIEQCKQPQVELSQGHMDLIAMNEMFRKWTNDLNDSLNNW